LESNVTVVTSPDEYAGGDLRILLAGVSDAWMVDIFNFYTALDQHTVIHTVTDDNFSWIVHASQSCDKIILDLNTYTSPIAGWLLRDRKCYWLGRYDLEFVQERHINDPLGHLIEFNKEIF